jgi:hypothetical protein
MKKFLLAALLFAVASPAWSRAAPRNETRICEGTVELNQPGANPDWYRIADCHFDGTKEGKAITSDYFGVDRLLIKIRFGIPDRSTTVSVCGKGSVADLALFVTRRYARAAVCLPMAPNSSPWDFSLVMAFSYGPKGR